MQKQSETQDQPFDINKKMCDRKYTIDKLLLNVKHLYPNFQQFVIKQDGGIQGGKRLALASQSKVISLA